jgi:VIT1/CCC1 family predicted Fe2+/Mn2+ transporter
MPTTPHLERHFTATETVRDIVIGMSDGLTVPFALAAGLSGAVKSTGIVVTAGLAEIAAGSIAMGLGGYLAAKTDLEHYLVALFLFGFVKGHFTAISPLRGGVQTVFIGGLAAAAAFAIARLIG